MNHPKLMTVSNLPAANIDTSLSYKTELLGNYIKKVLLLVESGLTKDGDVKSGITVHHNYIAEVCSLDPIRPSISDFKLVAVSVLSSRKISLPIMKLMACRMNVLHKGTW